MAPVSRPVWHLAIVSALLTFTLVLTACGVQAPPLPRTPVTSAPACSMRWCAVMDENFDRVAELGSFERVYGADWAGYPAGHEDTTGKGRYWPSKVLSAEHGVLDWWVHSEGGQPLTAAPLPQGYAGQQWGRWTVRFRADQLPGSKLAFLLWPDSDRWSDGEIDFPEGELGQAIYGFSHNVEGMPQRNQFKFDPHAKMSTWHTAEIEWTPERLTFTLDGDVSKSTSSAKALPKISMHPVLQVETSLEGPAPDPSTEGHVQVDWVKIERYNPSGS